MDQDAFRQLVSAPREEVVGRGQGYDRNFGQASYKNRERRRAQRESHESQPDWKPRQVGGTEFRGSHSKHAYMDRAEMRRRGIEMPLDVRLPSLPDPEADPAGSENEVPPVSDADLEQAWESGRTEPGVVASSSGGTKAAFRPITEAKEAPDVIYVNGKRMRKKKKKAPEASLEPLVATPEEPSHATTFRPRKATSTQGHTQTPLSSHSPTAKNSIAESSAPSSDTHALQRSASTITGEQKESSPTQGTTSPADPSTASVTSAGVESSDAPKARPPARPTFVPEVDDDDDIFADAGEWEGLSDEETPATKAAPAKHGDWFAPSSAAPTDLASPAAPEARTPPPHSPRSATPDTPPTRLEGLSTSALPTEMIRSLLSREDEAPARRSGAAPKRKRSKKGRGDPDSP